MRVKKQQLESCMEQLICSGMRKEYNACVLLRCLFNLNTESEKAGLKLNI